MRVFFVGLLSVVYVITLFGPQAARSAATSIVISEIQTGLPGELSKEFIELYNPTDTPISLRDWKLRYKSATGITWSLKKTLSSEMPAYGYYLISTTGYLSGATDEQATLGLSGESGHIRLEDSEGVIIDTLGWGELADGAEGTPALAPPAGQSLERKPGWLDEAGGNAVDTSDNAADFLVRLLPQPQWSNSEVEQPKDLTELPEALLPVEEEQPDTPLPVYLPLQISELYVDPIAPETDVNDEFIELYNPNDEAVELKNYVLKSGSNLHDYFQLQPTILAAKEFFVLSASTSNLSLTNTGGRVQLLDPTGKVLDETPDYGKAEPGLSFAKGENGWAWTTELTEGKGNIITAPIAAAAVKAAATAKPKATVKKAVAKPKAATKKATAKAKPAKKSAVKATKAVADVKTDNAKPLVAVTKSQTGKWLLIAAAVFTIGYALYEFRYDLQNSYLRARRYFTARRAHRKTP